MQVSKQPSYPIMRNTQQTKFSCIQTAFDKRTLPGIRVRRNIKSSLHSLSFRARVLLEATSLCPRIVRGSGCNKPTLVLRHKNKNIKKYVFLSSPEEMFRRNFTSNVVSSISFSIILIRETALTTTSIHRSPYRSQYQRWNENFKVYYLLWDYHFVEGKTRRF